LPGAVAKGAYEAGVIEVLAHKDISVSRIVATSSGALNGVAFAAGIRSGRTKEMAAKLVETWIEGGGWHDSLSISPWNLFTGRGLADRSGLLKMLNDLVTPCTSPKKHEIELRVVVAPLNGVQSHIGSLPTTTYEQVIDFSNKDFDSAESLANIFDIITAACAFPGLFAPVHVKGLGPCVDGGAVNNAPIRYALENTKTNKIIMPVPFPAMASETSPSMGLKMANHMIEILINERLFRDLKFADEINDNLMKLEDLVSKKIITTEQLDIVKSTLGIRTVEILQIRPKTASDKNAFSGFFSKKDRIFLVGEGRKAATQALSKSESK